MYSAKKRRAKGPPAYSTLYPDTSSDSPSVKSKGARFVSASVETYHIAAGGQAGRANHVVSWAVASVCILKFPENMIIDSRISPRLIS